MSTLNDDLQAAQDSPSIAAAVAAALDKQPQEPTAPEVQPEAAAEQPEGDSAG